MLAHGRGRVLARHGHRLGSASGDQALRLRRARLGRTERARGAPVTPLATEFLVEAQSGGTCVLRVVSSAFGTGADWEQEFFDEMERHVAAVLRPPSPLPHPFPRSAGHGPGGRRRVSGHPRRRVVGDAPGPRRRGSRTNPSTSAASRRGSSASTTCNCCCASRVPFPVSSPSWPTASATTWPVLSCRATCSRPTPPRSSTREQPAWKAWLDNLAVPAV